MYVCGEADYAFIAGLTLPFSLAQTPPCCLIHRRIIKIGYVRYRTEHTSDFDENSAKSAAVLPWHFQVMANSRAQILQVNQPGTTRLPFIQRLLNIPVSPE